MRTLIVYSSTYGFTKDCVEDLKGQLNESAVAINLESESPPPIDSFDAVLLGSSVYMGQLSKKLKAFASDHKTALEAKPLCLFLSCGIPGSFDEALRSGFPEALVNHALTAQCFGGELRIDKMKLGHKLLTSVMKKASQKNGVPDPQKNTEAIREMARIVNSLSGN